MRTNRRPVVHARPTPGTRTGRVWEIADGISRETGRRAARREVLDRVAEEGGNLATANTQYQYWLTNYHVETNETRTAEEPHGSVSAQALEVGRDGRLVIPREMREAMLLDADRRVTACVEEGELRVLSRRAAIRRMQAEAQRLKTPGTSEVDAFLAERREMWGQRDLGEE